MLRLYLVLGVLLCGCTDSGVPGDGETSSQTPPRTENADGVAPDTPQPQVPTLIDDLLLLNECHGVSTRAIREPTILGANPPFGWNPRSDCTVAVSLDVLACARLSYATLERPVTLAVQTHDNLVVEGNCAAGAGDRYDVPLVVHQILVNDSEVLSSLESLGLPALAGTFSETQEETQGLVGTRWDFSPVDGPESWLTKPITAQPDFRTGITYRMFWQNALGGISYMDWTQSFFSNGLDVVPVWGMISDPFLHPPGVNVYADLGNTLKDSHVQADIQNFGDLECAHPF